MTNNKDREDELTIAYLLGVRHGREDERAKIAAEASQLTQSDPEAMRYGFDGFGYKYIDSGSGSDWRTRHPDAEPLYLSQPTQSDALREALEAAPLIGATESAESFKARQDAWLNGQYRAALDQSKCQ